MISDPSRVYNGDETGFYICPSTGKVFAKRSSNVYVFGEWCDMLFDDVFRPVEVAWRNAVRKWQIDNFGESLNKINFAPLLKTVVDSSIKPEYLIKGFKLCGLCPFCADAVDYSKCLGAGSKETNTSDGETNNVSMDYRCFKSIVGEETIEKFEKIETILAQDNNDHFYKLYELWQHFKAPRKLNSCKKIRIIQDVTLKKHNEPAQKIMQSFDDNRNQKASTSRTIETEELTHQSVLSPDVNLDSIASTLDYSIKNAFHDHIRTTYPTTKTVIIFCVTYATRRILTSIISPEEDEDEPYEYDTEQTARNIKGVAKEVHGLGTRKEKVMETYAEESDEEKEKTYVDENTHILLNMYQEETSFYNYKRNPPLS
ncbi:hypothetical protein JTB14_026841 [Gonioctena quinquepunctata]|nr:hypothetical protein JTB14_026841 [Gonioctena quinquepunctata]